MIKQLTKDLNRCFTKEDIKLAKVDEKVVSFISY